MRRRKNLVFHLRMFLATFSRFKSNMTADNCDYSSTAQFRISSFWCLIRWLFLRTSDTKNYSVMRFLLQIHFCLQDTYRTGEIPRHFCTIYVLQNLRQCWRLQCAARKKNPCARNEFEPGSYIGRKNKFFCIESNCTRRNRENKALTAHTSCGRLILFCLFFVLYWHLLGSLLLSHRKLKLWKQKFLAFDFEILVFRCSLAFGFALVWIRCVRVRNIRDVNVWDMFGY